MHIGYYKILRPNGRHKRFGVYRCDRCQVIYDDQPSKCKRKIHLCSRVCLDASHRNGDLLHKTIQKSINERHGSDFYQRRGKHLTEFCTSEEGKAKIRRSFLERYGVESAVEIPHVRKQCLILTSGIAACEKRKKTTRERFGVNTVLAIPEIHALANTPEKCQQRHETMKRNGTYFTSKPEDEMFEYLKAKYDEVDRQVTVNAWPIDFYVKSIDTYVQFDGEYWHGLNRPLEEIKQFKTPRDRTIMRKYEIDREQENWFREANMKLIRVTDKQTDRGGL